MSSKAVAFVHQAGGTQTTLGYDPSSDTTPTLAKSQTLAVAFAQNQRDEVRTMEVAGALPAEPEMKQQTYVAQPFTETAGTVYSAYGTKWNGNGAADTGDLYARNGMQVRRLTPRECERLQGFPDDYTLIPHRGKPAADGPRYKALGNSMAVPCMRFLGERIAMVDELLASDREELGNGRG